MNKKTKLWMISMLLMVTLITAILYLIYTHEETYSFRAYVKEVYHNRIILIPISSDKLRYSSVIARNITDVSQGQIITLTIRSEYRQVYPPIVEVISYEKR